MDLIPLLMGLAALLFLAGLAFLLARYAGLFGRTPGGTSVTRSEIRKYAKRYLRRFPNTGRKGLREVLKQEFVPEHRVSNRDEDREMLGCFLFGLAGLAAAIVAQQAAANMNDDAIRRIKDDIEDVVDELIEDEE